MQHEHYDSAYGRAAGNGIPMDNHWMTPELNLQPHAWEMHGGADGAG